MEGDPDTPAARADSDLVLHVVTDAHALLPGLLAGAAERLAAVPSAGRGDLADHVEAFEDTIAALLDATADAVEGAPRPGFAALRVRAREMADAIDAEPWRARVPAAAGGDARLASRHVTSHQLLRLVVRLAPEV